TARRRWRRRAATAKITAATAIAAESTHTHGIARFGIIPDLRAIDRKERGARSLPHRPDAGLKEFVGQQDIESDLADRIASSAAASRAATTSRITTASAAATAAPGAPAHQASH